jgi:hypothetical protein
LSTSWPSLAKSADKIDGAIRLSFMVIGYGFGVKDTRLQIRQLSGSR